MALNQNSVTDTITPSTGTLTVSGTLSGTTVIANTVALPYFG
jgi:hypothetical protein